MSGNYTDEIPFTTVTLLKFTDDQREKFIKGWFLNKTTDKPEKLIEHLKKTPELSKIVRLPLLTTILCILAENDIPLPNSETRLYQDRLRLLLGQYDIHKQVSRVKSDKRHLEQITKKLAFLFHKNQTRQDSKFKIIKTLTANFEEKISPEKIELAVNELIDPCNILIPMSEDGLLGFGHLRYQEFLAAKELCNNRGVDILPFMTQSWWNGSLTIFSQLTDDIEFIIDSALKIIPISRIYETLKEMIKVRPSKEREYLLNIIERNRALDRFDPLGDEFFNENNYDDFDEFKELGHFIRY